MHTDLTLFFRAVTGPLREMKCSLIQLCFFEAVSGPKREMRLTLHLQSCMPEKNLLKLQEKLSKS